MTSSDLGRPPVGASPDGLPPLREVIAAHGLRAKRSLGQNFILDLNLTRRIARLGGPLADTTVVEVGPGPGGLTRALLLEGASRVVTVERDQRCLPALAEIADRYPGRLEVNAGDALAFDWNGVLGQEGGHGRTIIVANLPYSIATLLLVGWLDSEPWPPWYERMVLMFQKEVAERIVAAPGNKSYGRLSVLAQWRTIPRLVMNLKPEAFTPPPKVASAVVELVPRPAPEPAGASGTLARVTAAAFGQRRKMLRQSLKAITAMPELLLARAGIAAEERAERLTVAQFAQLARLVDEAGLGVQR